MTTSTNPRPFPEWRSDSSDRAEDAAYAFGHDLIVHCRDEALATIPPHASLPTRVAVENQIAPCRLDLPIGYWKWARDREFR